MELLLSCSSDTASRDSIVLPRRLYAAQRLKRQEYSSITRRLHSETNHPFYPNYSMSDTSMFRRRARVLLSPLPTPNVKANVIL